MNTAGIIGHSAQLARLDRLLERREIPHAMLFTGLPGTGKKLVARRFLAALFCGGENPPCLACPSCRQARAGSHPDLIELGPGEKGRIPIGSPDGSEQGSVRWLAHRLSKRSLTGACGVIIDGMETMSAAGQNALLKTVEEPQPGAHIIILTANRSLMLPTIISRCSEIPFHPLSDAEVSAIMAAERSGGVPSFVAAISGGSVERAAVLMDDNLRNSLVELCGKITSTVADGAPFDGDLAAFQKTPGYETLLDMLISVYRHVLLAGLRGEKPISELAGEGRVGTGGAVKLIKIFLALKKGLLNNLNMKISLKGMLYSIDGMDDIGIPDLSS